jgi:valyl-tRNA synthetase
MGVTPGNDQNWGWGKIEANRNFCNKLWNVARYIEGLAGEDFTLSAPEAKTAADHWVLNKLQRFTEVTAAHLDAMRFSEAYEELYHFVWDDFADWYIEASKAEQNLPLLAHCLEAILTVAHPFAPFVTETIWQTLAWEGGEEVSLLAQRHWPQITTSDDTQAKAFEQVKAVVSEARFITHALHVQGATLLYSGSEVISSNSELVKRLARLGAVQEGQEGSEGVALTSTTEKAWLDIDADTARKYGEELKSKLEAQDKIVKQLESRLSNDSYVQNAPEAVVQQTRDQLEEAKQQLETLSAERKRFS